MTPGERAFSFGRESMATPGRMARNLLGRAPSSAVELRDRGAIVEVLVAHPTSVAEKLKTEGRQVAPPFRALAMVDTGASITAIERTVAERLGLLQTGTAHVGGVTSGVEQQPVYAAQLGIVSPRYTLDPWSMIGSPIGRQGFHVLIGRDALEKLTLTYDGASGTFQLKPAAGGGGAGSTVARVAGVTLAAGTVLTAIGFATKIIRA